jgi:hypothetical protein
LSFDVVIDQNLNRNIVLQSILTQLQDTFNIKNFHIDQPIIVNDINREIQGISGVISVNNLLFNDITGITNGREYSSNSFDVQAYTRRGMIFPPPGAIFEIRYPEYDIVAATMQ